jgi:hypothetical protein
VKIGRRRLTIQISHHRLIKGLGITLKINAENEDEEILVLKESIHDEVDLRLKNSMDR